MICVWTQYFAAYKPDGSLAPWREWLRVAGPLLIASAALFYAVTFLLIDLMVHPTDLVRYAFGVGAILLFGSSLLVAFGIWPPREV